MRGRAQTALFRGACKQRLCTTPVTSAVSMRRLQAPSTSAVFKRFLRPLYTSAFLKRFPRVPFMPERRCSCSKKKTPDHLVRRFPFAED